MLLKGTYKHYKGNFYDVIDFATHSETEELMVIYKNSDGRMFVRPYAMFAERIWQGDEQVNRFEYVPKPGKPVNCVTAIPRFKGDTGHSKDVPNVYANCSHNYETNN